MPKTKYCCKNCDKEFFRYASMVRKPEIVCCCTKCAVEYRVKTGAQAGPNNSNYGTIWSHEQRDKASKEIKKRYEDPEYRYNIGKSNRGKTLSRELVERMHDRPIESYRHPHSDESKRIIGEKSKAKWQNEAFRIKFRKAMEKNGYWTPLSEISNKALYYRRSHWISEMIDLIEDISQINLLRSRGIFNSSTNTDGIVRDHIYSRKSGYENRVFPEILRHPCNCQLLSRNENIRKYFQGDDRQTLEELFEKIFIYNGVWHEHELVLNLIEDYKNGKKWNTKRRY